MALASKNELRLLHIFFPQLHTHQAHLFYHLQASLTMERLPATRQVIGVPAVSSTWDFQFSFVCTEDLEKRVGKVKVNDPSTLFC